MNLVDSYLAVATGNGEPVSHALAQINEELGTRYGANRIYEWRDGRRSVPERVQRYMMAVAIERAIHAEGGGVPEDRLDALVDRLSPPVRRSPQTSADPAPRR